VFLFFFDWKGIEDSSIYGLYGSAFMQSKIQSCLFMDLVKLFTQVNEHPNEFNVWLRVHGQWCWNLIPRGVLLAALLQVQNQIIKLVPQKFLEQREYAKPTVGGNMSVAIQSNTPVDIKDADFRMPGKIVNHFLSSKPSFFLPEGTAHTLFFEVPIPLDGTVAVMEGSLARMNASEKVVNFGRREMKVGDGKDDNLSVLTSFQHIRNLMSIDPNRFAALRATLNEQAERAFRDMV
jgi:hypothetical protein